MKGRFLMEEEDEGTWVYGVNPGGMTASEQPEWVRV